ncbi:MAG: transposase [Bacteroidota bacterium]
MRRHPYGIAALAAPGLRGAARPERGLACALGRADPVLGAVHVIKETKSSLLETEWGRRLYRIRKALAEPVFGQIKSCMGFTQFSFRGLAKVKAEWDLVCLCHNLRKLYRFRLSEG